MSNPTAALGFDPSATPDILAGLIDSGRWRERGITHWHLVRDEQPYTINGRSNDARFSTERISTLVNRAMIPVARTPLEALTWLTENWIEALKNHSTPALAAAQRGWHDGAAWRFQLEHCWETLAGGSLSTPAGGGMSIGVSTSLALHCYPMNAARCRAHQRARADYSVAGEAGAPPTPP